MRRVSVTVIIATLLVAVTTIVLGAFGTFTYISRRNEQLARLKRVTIAQTEELATALALPVWNIDRPQIDKVLDSQATNPPIEAVVVHAAGRVHARMRDAKGNFVPSDEGVVQPQGLIVAEQAIVFGAEEIGSVRIYMTPRIIEAELRKSLIQTIVAILVVDILLVLSIYLLLWRTILRPLVTVERYAAAVSSGNEALSVKPARTSELERLRLSIERMVNAIRSEKEFTETAIDVVKEIFFVQARDGRFVRWNKATVDFFGAELLQREDRYILRNIVHPDDRPVVWQAIEEVFDRSGSAECTVRYLFPDHERILDLTARRMEADSSTYIVVTGVDVTDQRIAEAERRRLRQVIEQSAIEWQETFDSVEAPIVITTKDGNIRRMNEPAIRLARQSTTDPVSHITQLDEIPWNVAATLQGGIAQDKNGRTWDIRVTPLFAETDDHSLIIIFFDITRIVALQESLRRSETTTAMGKLVGGVAHEVRNPLFGISATLDAYGEEMNTPELQEMAITLKSQVGRLSRLMRELLEFGKPVAVTRQPGALNAILEEVVASRRDSARDAKVDVKNLVADSTLRIPMDRDRLIQVFENLVDNALQHSPRGSAITISGEPMLHAGREWVELNIDDEGQGFPPGDTEQVFEPFFTRREHGTGLGLSIVRKIVEEHEGSVIASNRQGGGARVTIRLPVS